MRLPLYHFEVKLWLHFRVSSKRVKMKMFILCLRTLLLQASSAYANGEAAALDQMILHHKMAI